MEFFEDLDFLKIGKFIRDENKIVPINYYGEHILNMLSLNLAEDPKRFLKIFKGKKKRVFMVGGIKYSVFVRDKYIYVQEITEFFDDINNFVDLLSLQHEIKNPLTVINGAAQLLKLKAKGEFINDTAEIILKESKRIQGLLDNISVLFKDIKCDDILAKKFLDELVESIKVAYPDISIFVDIDPEISVFYGDRSLLYIALFNILKNSCDANKNTTINISLSVDVSMKLKLYANDKSLKMLKFTVSDTSGGIKNDDLERIFNPFFTTKSKGSGLGLFIAKHIIEKHNGRIYLNTVYGYGTTFIVLIPYRYGGKSDKSISS